jgi:hypothetical protein
MKADEEKELLGLLNDLTFMLLGLGALVKSLEARIAVLEHDLPKRASGVAPV